MARARKLAGAGSRYESVRPAAHGPATGAPPGSLAKVEAMCGRFARRRALHSPGDPADEAGRRLGMLMLAGVIARPDDSALAERMRRDVTRAAVGAPRPAGGDGKKQSGVNAPATPGDRIAHARRAAGLSLGELARRAGVSKAALCRAERRERTPSLEVLRRVADSLCVSLDWLCCVSREAGRVRCLCA